eukprot:699739-Karenia_brevis.AAC.1
MPRVLREEGGRVHSWTQGTPPDACELQTVICKVRCHCQRLAREVKDKRVQVWAEQLKESMRSAQGGSKHAYRWCKGEFPSALTMLEREDGSCTGNAMEIDGLLRQTWCPVFQKYANAPEPGWTCFEERFGKYVKECPI